MPKEILQKIEGKEMSPKEEALKILKGSAPGMLFYIPYPGRINAFASTNVETATKEQINANMQENPLLDKLTAQEIIDACIETKEFFTLLSSLDMIEKRGFVDKDKLVTDVLNAPGGPYAEYIVKILKEGKLGKLKDETLLLLSSISNGKYKDEIIKYQQSLSS